MNIRELRNYKRAAIEFVDFKLWQNPLGLTLTYKRWDHPEPSTRIPIDQYAVEQNLHHFLNVLNGKLLTKSERKRGKRIGAYAVFEKDQDGRPHAHVMIECPDPDIIEQMPALVARLWRATNWGYRDTKVLTCYDDGWVDYCSKFRTKPDYVSDHDWLAFDHPIKKVT